MMIYIGSWLDKSNLTLLSDIFIAAAYPCIIQTYMKYKPSSGCRILMIAFAGSEFYTTPTRYGIAWSRQLSTFYAVDVLLQR